jgi:(p)ppGpp synthase/HD superfamily hydrolase
MKLTKRTEKQERFFRNFFTKHDLKYSLIALDIVNQVHVNIRKDGSEERSHLFEVLGFAISFCSSRMSKEELDKFIVVLALHDVVEDYPELYSFKELKKIFPLDVVKSLKTVTKWSTFTKTEKDYKKYHGRISKDLFGTLTKGFDRLHNLMSCYKVFSVKNKKRYIKETENYIIPNLKKMRKEYVEFYDFITLLIFNLKNQIEALNYMIELEER